MARLGRTPLLLLRKKGFTAYQIRVYKIVAGIPFGQTRSYKWVARRIKSPYSSRAVGQALNKNPCPSIVPCHRVIKSDDSIGGFARGKLAKMRLLKAEGVAIINSKIRR